MTKEKNAKHLDTAQNSLIESLLRKTPKDLISKREGPGGMMLSYVSWAVVARRLTEAFGVWSFEMMGAPAEINMPNTKKGQERKEIMVTMAITTPAIPGWRVEGCGSAIFYPDTEQAYSDVIQSAESYALRRIAARIGPGQDLYAKTEEPEKDPVLDEAIAAWKKELNDQGVPSVTAITLISEAMVNDPKGLKTLNDVLDATGKEGAEAYNQIVITLRGAVEKVVGQPKNSE